MYATRTAHAIQKRRHGAENRAVSVNSVSTLPGFPTRLELAERYKIAVVGYAGTE